MNTNSQDLYPGLVVDDGRVSGSITLGESRLPLWALIPAIINEGVEAASDDWDIPGRYGYTVDELREYMANLTYNLLQPRGDFARLLLTLANAEENSKASESWQDDPVARARVRAALQACIDELDS